MPFFSLLFTRHTFSNTYYVHNALCVIGGGEMVQIHTIKRSAPRDIFKLLVFDKASSYVKDKIKWKQQ